MRKWRDRLGKPGQPPPWQTWGLVVLLFLALQVGLWSLGVPPAAHDNLEWWTALSTLAEARGFFNVWTPYPPLFPLVHYGLVRLLGSDPEARARYFFQGDPAGQAAAHQTVAHLQVAWLVLNGLGLAAQTVLIYALAQSFRPRAEARRASGAFLLFNLSWRSRMVLGPTLDQFDYLPGVFLLLALLLLIHRQARASALVTALGLLTKLYPGLLVPLAWAHLGPGRRAWHYPALAAGACLLAAAPLLYVHPEIFLTTYRWTATRSGWESVWTYPQQAFPPTPVPAAMPGLFDLPFYEALLELDSGEKLPGRVVREQPQSLLFEFLDGTREEFPKARLRSLQLVGQVAPKYRRLLLATLALLLALTWRFREAFRTPEGLLRGTFLFLLILLFFSKGISHYFVLWFFPFLFLLYRPLCAAGLFSLFLLVGHLEFVGDPQVLPGYWPSLFLRQGLWLLLGLEQLWRLHRRLPAAAEGAP